jgi:hypothetical protein
MVKNRYAWFIDPKGDPKTNQILSNSLSPENACNDKLCQDGERRNLWRCPNYEFIANFKRMAKANKLPYDLYVREGTYGPLRIWSFDEHASNPKNRARKVPIKYINEEAAMLAGISF